MQRGCGWPGFEWFPVQQSWHRVQTEMDGSCSSRGHLAASIQTDRSIAICFFYPLSTCCPLNRWDWGSEVTLIATPSSSCWTISSRPAYLRLIHLPSLRLLSLSLHQWRFGLLICQEERSLADEHCLSCQAHTWSTAGNQWKKKINKTKQQIYAWIDTCNTSFP